MALVSAFAALIQKSFVATPTKMTDVTDVMTYIVMLSTSNKLAVSPILNYI